MVFIPRWPTGVTCGGPDHTKHQETIASKAANPTGAPGDILAAPPGCVHLEVKNQDHLARQLIMVPSWSSDPKVKIAKLWTKRFFLVGLQHYLLEL